MNLNGQPPAQVDINVYLANRERIDPDQLLPFAGKHVAWSLDGTRILANGDSAEQVDEKLAALGIHWSQVVHDYIDAL